MRNRFATSTAIMFGTMVVALLVIAPASRPQQASASKKQKAVPTESPVPRHDISGTWAPANGYRDGTQPHGVYSMPYDGKPEHDLPFTPYGLETFKSHKALEGIDAVLPQFSTDPRNKCEPLGFPRAMFHNVRDTQIMQNEYKVAILYEYAQAWRVIWTDGRALPKVVDGGVMVGKEIQDPRFYGYSVGKWVDDTTLVVQTVGTMPEDRVWLDLAGRPISDALHVEERFHRLSRDRMELTVTIDDPKMYTKPWIAMNKFPMKLEDPHTDVMEIYCSPSELEKYNKLFGDPSSDAGSSTPEK